MGNVENELVSKFTFLEGTCLKSIAELLEVEVIEKNTVMLSVLKSLLYYLNSGETEQLENAGLSLFLKVNDVLTRSINSSQKQQFSISNTELLKPNIRESENFQSTPSET